MEAVADLLTHITAHQEAIHSNNERDQLSATDGKQNILAFQKRLLYPNFSESIHQCNTILFFDFSCIFFNLFINGQSQQICNSYQLTSSISEKASTNKCNPFKG
jgi:hypothetical protein